jgi:tRNA (guanine37-N1)-methyltransferase
MRIDVVTIFPEMLAAVSQSGITARALEKGFYSLHTWQPREFAANAYRTVDDRPYGGGPGMVMMAEPLDQALSAAKAAQQQAGLTPRCVYLSPQGKVLDHTQVLELAALREAKAGLVLLCGRYEGVDERVLEKHVDLEVSIGDYVLSGGELAAMVLIDAIVRQWPGVLGDVGSADQDSFAAGRQGLLDCPHYTRPEVWQGVAVPPILMSGHHEKIEDWRSEQSRARTKQKRPDLFGKQ